MMMAQKADMFASKTGYNLIPADQSVIPLQELSQEGLFITSPYNCSRDKAIEDSVKQDIMDSIYVSLDVWLTILATVCTIAVMVNVHFKNHRLRPPGPETSSIWTVLSFLLLQPSMREVNWTSKLLSLVMATLAFLVIV